ncbi:MAG: hypothetical protein L6R40_003386 [Gallowayella cf. fulva]|nr:MAG: hypothetical protein L6R40_003386 [Xanthomendoza cf. fulva]
MQDARYTSNTYWDVSNMPTDNTSTNPELSSLHQEIYYKEGDIETTPFNCATGSAGQAIIHPAANDAQDRSDILPSCEYPRCYAVFYDQRLLHEHRKIHFGGAGNLTVNAVGPVNYGGASFPDPMLPPVTAGSPYDQDLDQNPYGGPTMADMSNILNIPTSHTYPSIPSDDGGPNPTTALPATSSAASPSSRPSGRLACSVPGCNTTFARAGDLHRHAKKHAPGPKQYACPTPGCPREGLRAFDRKDKMLSHYEGCQRYGGFLAQWDYE